MTIHYCICEAGHYFTQAARRERCRLCGSIFEPPNQGYTCHCGLPGKEMDKMEWEFASHGIKEVNLKKVNL